MQTTCFPGGRGGAGGDARSDDSSFLTSGLQDSVQLKQRMVAVYAVRGRRANMEDMFDYVNETERLGVELFAVFDGHGSDVRVPSLCLPLSREA